ncbi:YhgE/Pip domain-containing protein [Microbacterium azadirachtae]|uniref:YhgE/Pip domain-containing protein n=1 Tax=Microbacterium azadirachtae TaxID=582680 RepID=UPI00088EE407|nr:YhgE/Pip domain-containing protein [Microbacterium azadirachtae]SDL64756.1 putative membrane protein [Microbacterium azadirachtae]SEF93965.1 putative membrane protein [Microbacterium azadirachtae]SEF96507.1 putative membrane protein [Microbacterium azadirachtae]
MKIPAMVGAELRRLTASPMAVIALIALMAVPILYGGLYLWANQDPYGKFTEVPVGLVVDDAGVTSGDTTTNYGEKVADNLVEGKAFDWQRLSAPAARAALKNGDVDFTVTIPKDFSEALLSSSGTSPHQARIELETNDANNYLASSIGSGAVEKIRRSVAEMVGQEAADKLLTGLSDVRAKLGEAADGAGKLFDGANTAVSGSGQLADGTAQLADGAAQLAGGTQQLADGSQQLADGAATLADGAQQMSAGNQQLAQYANEAGSLVQQATDALPQVRSDIATALADRGLSPAEVDAVLAKLDPLGDKLRNGNDTVQGAVGKIDQLADGSAQVASGSATLADKSQQLANGAQTAASGAAALSTGAASARDGAKALHDGLGTLANGIATLRDGLKAGVDAIPSSTPELREQQAKTIANPVDVSSDKVAAAKDYGQGLAPFFAALAGWIGIYALFLIIKPISRRAATALHSPIRITLAGWLTPAGFGALQMLGLLGVLAWALGFTFQNGWGALGIMVVASATYAAIILALNVWLGSVGQFMGLVLMVLQLVTAGGTFPWQTLPAPLAALHHVLPMGYVVDAMRQLMYGGQVGRAMTDLGVLGIWLVGSLLVAMIGVTRMTHKRTLRDLQPSLIG